MVPVRDEEVRGLDVAMDDPAAMRCVERVSNLPGEIEYARDRDRSCFDQLPDGSSLQPFHGDERLTVLIAELVDRADVRMLEGRRQSRFAFEPRAPVRSRADIFLQELDGNFTAEPEVLRAVHHSHAAIAEAVEQTVVGNNGRFHRDRA